MSASCQRSETGVLELYFYGELAAGERAEIAGHAATCAACRAALDELRVIGEALSTRPRVTAPAGGDWTAFMARLNDALGGESAAVPGATASRAGRGAMMTYLAMAAILTLVTASVAFRPEPVSRRAGPVAARPIAPDAAGQGPPRGATPVVDRGLAALSEQHFERSKLVVLGLATRDPRRAATADWQFERQLASSLLPDTRLYRRAAQDRGMTRLAEVMSDLEIVLLQASLSDDHDRQALPQLQRLIRKRDLVTKMDVMAGR